MPEISIMKRNLARPTPTCLLVLLKSWRKLPAHIISATAHMDGAIALELTFIVWTVDKKISLWAVWLYGGGQKGWFKIFRETHEPILEEVTWASPSWHQQSITSFPVIWVVKVLSNFVFFLQQYSSGFPLFEQYIRMNPHHGFRAVSIGDAKIGSF